MPRFGNDVVQTGRDDPSLLDVPTWDAVKASASEAFNTSPTVAMGQSLALDVQRGDITQSSASVARFGRLPDYERKSAVRLTQAQAQAKIDAAGLTGRLTVPEEGENEGALDALMQYKSDEVRNQFVLGNYRGGIAGGATQLATGLAVSLVDPINIGSAFLPIVGEARYAQMLGRAGQSMTARAATRFGVGAIEGTVGAAMVEPLIYQSKQAIQADYGTMDSMMNIGFGGLFGAVLQPAAGGVADVLARRAGTGAWAENIKPDLTADDPVAPEGFTMGGGTRYIEGDDYVRGQWAIADASTLRSTGNPFDAADAGQLGASPWSDSGAPVVGPDGAVRNGNRRMATILRDYEGDGNGDYRSNLIEQAEQYGLDSDAVQAMEKPVLVRVEGTRDVGAWGEYRKIAENSPQARATRVPFASPDTVAARAFTERARGLGVPDATAEALAPVAPRDDVTGFYDGRQDGMKAATVQRALDHIAETGQEGVYVSADIGNLGGLNNAVGNKMEAANAHFQGMTGILERELRALGADLVPMRTGGDEMGVVVVGANVEQVDAALTKASAAVAEYARANGLADIPHPKRSDGSGVGLHFGLEELRPGDSLSSIFDAADDGVDLSKNGNPYGRQAQVEAFRASRPGASSGQPGSAAAGTGKADSQPGGRAISAEARFTKIGRRALPESETLVTPLVPTAEQMKAHSHIESVPLSRVRSVQREMRFEQFDRGESPGALIEGYGDMPVAVRRRDGEVLIYDGNHRTATALSGGQKEMQMHVIDAAAYDPEAAGRAPARRASIEEDEALLAELGITEAPRLTEEQQRAATQVGVAQAVNGQRIDVAAVGELDGTRAGVERFLEAKRVADGAEAAARDRQATDMDAMRRELERFDPANAEKLDKELADMEAALREQVKAAGGDEADIDAALAEVNELAEAADTETKALRGVALCMLRSA